MAKVPTQISLQVQPKARLDVINLTQKIYQQFGDILLAYPRALYCSHHTTAGYIEQSLCARLHYNPNHVTPFIRAFQMLFPPGADYRHDQLELRAELSDEQRQCEPRNADSHLVFISTGLKNCVTYVNDPEIPVYFIDLDGVHGNEKRTRFTDVVAFNKEKHVEQIRLAIPVSRHPIDSINLKDPRLGVFDQLQELIHKYGISKGRIIISLSPTEQHAGLTVNEYETLLMRHDLAEVLHNPLKFMAQKGMHMLQEPWAIPSKTLNYAKYDLVHVFNELMDALNVSNSVVERILSKFLRAPAERFLRMKRNISLLVSDMNDERRPRIVFGRYQSPILVQWKASEKQTRYVDVVITQFE